MSNIPKLSIVVPVYYNQDNLVLLYDDICNKLSSNAHKFSFELILVDDGSGDDSWKVMQQLAQADNRIKIYSLSKNFGSHAAIMCGLSHASGDCAVVKAADLQEPTEMIVEMFQQWQEGNNVVLAVRQGRADKSMFSELYYWMVRKVALPEMPKGGFDTFLLDRKVISVLELMDEKNSAITGQILWSGFKTSKVYYERLAREIGTSKWTLKKKIKLVSDTLFSFSNVPIKVISSIGALSCIASFIWAFFVFLSRILGNIEVSGFTTLFIFNLFSFGIIMFSIGLTGGYIWRMFDTTRGRPLYIIEEDNPKQEHNTLNNATKEKIE